MRIDIKDGSETILMISKLQKVLSFENPTAVVNAAIAAFYKSELDGEYRRSKQSKETSELDMMEAQGLRKSGKSLKRTA